MAKGRGDILLSPDLIKLVRTASGALSPAPENHPAYVILLDRPLSHKSLLLPTNRNHVVEQPEPSYGRKGGSQHGRETRPLG
jgi:hypothetical protein